MSGAHGGGSCSRTSLTKEAMLLVQAKCYADGESAAVAGAKFDECPYPAAFTHRRDMWLDGWSVARHAIANGGRRIHNFSDRAALYVTAAPADSERGEAP